MSAGTIQGNVTFPAGIVSARIVAIDANTKVPVAAPVIVDGSGSLSYSIDVPDDSIPLLALCFYGGAQPLVEGPIVSGPWIMDFDEITV